MDGSRNDDLKTGGFENSPSCADEGEGFINEEKLRTLFDTMKQGVVYQNAEGKIISANPAAERILGLTFGQMQGRTSMDPRWKAIRRDGSGFPGEEHPIPSALRTGEEVRGVVHGVYHPEKETIVWLLVNAVPLFRPGESKPYQAYGTIEDITDRVRAEEVLRLRESYLRAIIENQPGLVWLKDADSRFLAVNRAFAHSCGRVEPEDLVGKTDFDIWPADLAGKYQRDDAEVMKTGVPVKVEELISDKGEQRWFETFKTPVWTSQGEIIGTTGYAYDITERKLGEETQRNAQKLESLGLLAGGIAHDFNNLLGGIFGYIDLAIGTSADAETTRFLSKAMDTIDRARGLTRQLLTFAKGGEPVKKKDALFPFIQEAAQFALSGSKISCSFTIPDGLQICEFDRSQIGQVIDNIVINAQQAMPDGGTIEISAENLSLSATDPLSLPPGDYIRISIADHGIGMTAEILPRIFDPFYTTKPKGHGLGLSTCYSIMKRHKGAVTVESQPGKGSIFHLYLPALQGLAHTDAAVPISKHVGIGKVLVMDDEAVMRETIGLMLESRGYAVISTTNGDEALEVLAAEAAAARRPVGMIFDLTVPGGKGGREIIAEVKNRYPEIPVFVASGYADDPVMAQPQKFGFAASICKPFSRDELSSLLEKHIAVRHADV